MANYAIYIEDATGDFKVQVHRAPTTIPVGGTILSFDWLDNNNGASNVAKAITGATNATPIVLTVASGHGVVAGDPIFVSGVGGNTAANGTFVAGTVGATTIALQGSAGNAAYTSGGTFRELTPTKVMQSALQIASRAILNDRSVNG
jgi:hypothetical protein